MPKLAPPPDKIELGDEVRDTITGFAGTVTGVTEFITGCRQFSVQPKVKADGEFVTGHWIDEDRLEVVGSKRRVVEALPVTRLGGETPPSIR